MTSLMRHLADLKFIDPENSLQVSYFSFTLTMSVVLTL